MSTIHRYGCACPDCKAGDSPWQPEPMPEPVGIVQVDHVPSSLHGEAISIRGVLWASDQFLPDGTKLYTTPPSVAALQAKYQRAVEALVERFEAMHANEDRWITSIGAARVTRAALAELGEGKS